VPPGIHGSGAKGATKYKLGDEAPKGGEAAMAKLSKVKAKARFQTKKRQMVPMVAGGHQSSRASTPRAGVKLTAAAGPTAAAAGTTATAAAAATTANAAATKVTTTAAVAVTGSSVGAPVSSEQPKAAGSKGTKQERRAAHIQAMKCRRKSRFRSEAAC
jgi:hypothetical protein